MAMAAVAAAAKVMELVEKSGGAIGAAAKVIDQFNTWFGGVSSVQDKTRWLEITLVNLSTDAKLSVDDSWFDSGRFWSQPFQSLVPGTAMTFYVCNKDGSIMTGVSGGVGLEARYISDNSIVSDSGNSWWICTFSNPFSGSIKCLTRWKGYGIKGLWEEMDDTHMVRDERCGCYMKDDKKIVYIFKNPETPW
ncbi:hypothetical protein KP509_01G069000 [Ceratopteris richardii]|uniref:Uncharacterized protein n=1 Tax=Ceratopteris richardii TaxID=49495 RepID=A0A8T2VLQ6_CERRI|nr:hypothetical protein KP509_01G069000 [Ceratopteris richardii]